ncbi:hypothetical protein LZP73_17650 [Shewanella sp. AS16]|uniref:hypothetical protein n=1 Tax=Shewanella sp. AS16 TaxID=2907625 RepID=UPI001F1C07A5|nr:hypothetical protein [Shewanella sp. AS16]MCE9688003.1 hypothetical protein [Shewanella sp. AS16]
MSENTIIVPAFNANTSTVEGGIAIVCLKVTPHKTADWQTQILRNNEFQPLDGELEVIFAADNVQFPTLNLLAEMQTFKLLVLLDASTQEPGIWQFYDKGVYFENNTANNPDFAVTTALNDDSTCLTITVSQVKESSNELPLAFRYLASFLPENSLGGGQLGLYYSQDPSIKIQRPQG